MNLKKVTQKLAEIRDHVGDNGKLTEDNKTELKLLVAETIKIAQEKSKKKNAVMAMPDFDNIIVHNDNQSLSSDQSFRLSLVEKTGTGSHLIH